LVGSKKAVTYLIITNRDLHMPMLDQLKSSRSTAVIFSALRALTGDTSNATFTGVVSAEVDGEEIIVEENISVQLTNSRPNFATVHIHWEEHGYEDYRKLGLFGSMDTRWNEVKATSARSFRIYGENYEVEVCY